MEIVNRTATFREYTCQVVNSQKDICNISKEELENLAAPFEELRKEDKKISNIEELQVATGRVIERKNTLKRIKRKEENGGYVLVGSLTCLGTLAIGTIIFMAIKFIIVG